MLQDLYLGIDIGTTKVAAVLIDGQGGVQATASRAHDAGQPDTDGRAEQDAGVLLGATGAIIRQLPAVLRQRVGGIGVTGQMHGVVMIDAGGMLVSPLITWQDGRCLEEKGFLNALNEATGYRLYTGYGLATLAWLHRHQQLPPGAVSATTIHDLVVARLCALPKATTDPSSAASWGCFDLDLGCWDKKALEALGLPLPLLPTLHPFGSVAGALAPAMASLLGMPPAIPVHVALGDLQASLLSTIRNPATDVALTLGTGGQAAVIMPAPIDPEVHTSDLLCNYWPYPGGRITIVAASLSGGAAWAWLVDTLDAWLRDLGLEPPPSPALFDMINTLGLAASDELTVQPHFLGERHNPLLRGAIHDLTLPSSSLGALARGLARSIVQNLYTMLPSDVLEGKTRLVASGNALRHNPLLQQVAEEIFELPLHVDEGQEEAAIGAAFLAAGLIKNV